MIGPIDHSKTKKPASRTPLYLAAADSLAEQIADQPVGTRLPSEDELAGQLGVSRLTARAALAELERRYLGLLVSEVPPGAVPTRHRFIARARLMAALSTATVVVEAGARSGSMKVAERAQELGRIVGAVPGPVTSATSAGPHRLLRDKDCAVITDAADLYRALETRDVERGSSASLLMPERTVSSAREVRQL